MGDCGTNDVNKHVSVWYFGYGSMCNPTSLKRRGIIPFESQPAKLKGYKVDFQLGGMANLVQDETSMCHGVLHHVTMDMFKVLSAIEASYEVMDAHPTPYAPYNRLNGSGPAAGTCFSPVAAVAFTVHPEHLAKLQQENPGNRALYESLPSERYIRIITEGLRHFGVDPAWVEWVEAQPFAPTKLAADYFNVPTPADSASLCLYTLEQLAKYKGVIIDNKAVYAIGPKVVEVDLSKNPAGLFVSILQNFCGTETTHGICNNLYEPRLPPLHGPDDVTEEHIAWAEDAQMEWLHKQGFSIRQIGWLDKEA